MNKTLNILIVDDSPDDVHFIVRTLKQAGMLVNVHAINSGEQFKQKSMAQDWQLIILDYFVPSLDVVEMLTALQQHHIDTPVIIVSGQVQMDAAVELMRLGARDFIRKDDLSRLVPCVQRELIAAEQRRERRQALHDLKEARDAAELASQAKSDFLLMLNHELRTPLHGIMGMLDLLLADMHGMHEKQRDYARMSRMTADGMRELISDMLDLSKLEAGKSAIRHEAFDLQACLHSAMSPFFISAREKGLAFSLDLQHVPAHICSDRAHVHQMVVNLIGNAVKFTDQGSIALRASVQPMASGEEQLYIEVEDTGIGISAEHLPTIFEPFVQLYDREHQRPRGTGLGITLVQRFSALLGGRIEVSSELAVGSCFRLILPLQREGVGVVNRRITLNDWSLSYDVKKSTVDLSSLNKLRILVAEDDAVSQMLIVDSFERLGLSVDCADHGLQAWDKLQQQDYDVLLTDLRMPGLDGIELTKRVRASEMSTTDPRPSKDTTGLTIIGISAYAQADVRQQAYQAGMDAFITKPVNVAQVIDMVQQQQPAK